MLFNGLNLVKTIQFEKMRNLGNPIPMARVYNSRNVDELIFIDLKATEDNRCHLFHVVENIVKECFMPLTIGGGIHSIEDIHALLAIGADKIATNSEALERPEFVSKAAQKFGSQCIVASIDAKLIGKDYCVMKYRGKINSGLKVTEWAKRLEKLGAGEIFLNSVDNDGVMQGYDVKLIKKVVESVAIPVIACGGAGKVQDVIDAVLQGGANAVSLSSMFHYSGHTANSIKQRMAHAGIEVRLL